MELREWVDKTIEAEDAKAHKILSAIAALVMEHGTVTELD